MHTFYSHGKETKFKYVSKLVLTTVFPLRPYGAQLAQVLEKLAQQILWQCVKKMRFLGKSAYFQQKLEILALWPSKIV